VRPALRGLAHKGVHLAPLIEQERATVIAGVPTVLDDVHRVAVSERRDLSSVRLALCGGSAVPRSLIEQWRDDLGVAVLQGWGMTETSPLAAVVHPPKDASPDEESYWRSKSGRAAHGVRLRVVDELGEPVPDDGVSVGEIEVRGPWVTAGYYRNPAPESFHDGWLRTGDVGTIDDHAYIQVTDRAKDVIKSGGQWISSVELENLLAGHPDLLEAAVIGVPDDRWQERPAACVVAKPGTAPSFTELRAYLSPHVAKWWLPERWALVPEIPKTSVGKFDKKALRELYARGKLATEYVGSPQPIRDPRRSPGRQPA
jgi:acyl-CoA synthetase (AMP-forming)/AMP-acid ligase II